MQLLCRGTITNKFYWYEMPLSLIYFCHHHRLIKCFDFFFLLFTFQYSTRLKVLIWLRSLTWRKELLHVQGKITLLPKIRARKPYQLSQNVGSEILHIYSCFALQPWWPLTSRKLMRWTTWVINAQTHHFRKKQHVSSQFKHPYPSSLASNATRNDINGFYNASTGHDLYGLFHCRSDVSVEVCQNCLNLATNDISNREGGYHMIWWVLPALLKSWNDNMDPQNNIFSSMIQMPALYMMDPQIITVDVEFNKLLVNTISGGANEAARAPSGIKSLQQKKWFIRSCTVHTGSIYIWFVISVFY